VEGGGIEGAEQWNSTLPYFEMSKTSAIKSEHISALFCRIEITQLY
jgi:hypothetical protein